MTRAGATRRMVRICLAIQWSLAWLLPVLSGQWPACAQTKDYALRRRTPRMASLPPAEVPVSPVNDRASAAAWSARHHRPPSHQARPKLASMNGVDVVPRHVLVRDVRKRRPVGFIPTRAAHLRCRRGSLTIRCSAGRRRADGRRGPARSYIEKALENRDGVVTANTRKSSANARRRAAALGGLEGASTSAPRRASAAEFRSSIRSART